MERPVPDEFILGNLAHVENGTLAVIAVRKNVHQQTAPMFKKDNQKFVFT
ncbi:hypothetical protein [Acinetobacter beijerinckii]